MPKYLSAGEFAKLHGVAQVTVKQKCARGAIPGAFKVGEGRYAMWCIPADAEYKDGRIKSGKYIGAQRARKKAPQPEDSNEE